MNQQEGRSAGRWFFSVLEPLVFYLILIILCFTFLLRTTVVVGASMEPTLHDGDVLVISRVGYQPDYGDMVVITKPNYYDEVLLKRIIAKGGDTIDIQPETGQVLLNGHALFEPYVLEPTYLVDDVTFPVTVPEGMLFVMGDNRNRSSDSRSTKVGMIEEEYVLGRVILRLLPLGDMSWFLGDNY